jgi:tRNA threonylcarbamoyladenosine biosynthesis protein TsaB
VLAIETTGTLCSVCVYKSDSEYFNLSLMKEKVHSKKILSLIEFAMSEAGVEYSELSGICISEGPGSFTGLRLGFAAAKGIAFGQSIGIIKVPTFKSLAYEVSENMSTGTRGLIVTKAALEESYLFGFESTEDGFSELLPLQLVMNHDLNELIEQGRYENIYSNVKIDSKRKIEKSSPEAISIAKYAAKKLNFAFDFEIDFVEPYYFKNFQVKVK